MTVMGLLLAGGAWYVGWGGAAGGIRLVDVFGWRVRTCKVVADHESARWRNCSRKGAHGRAWGWHMCGRADMRADRSVLERGAAGTVVCVQVLTAGTGVGEKKSASQVFDAKP